MIHGIDEQTDDPPFGRIAIVGFGLIGASIALAARKRWASTRIIAVDRTDIVSSALRANAADDGGDALDRCAGADLIVLAAPVQANIRILCELPAHVSGETLVTDVGSTKRQMIESARRSPARFNFIGGHPLAGAATGGFDAARSDLFAGHPWILTPIDQQRTGVERLSRFIEGLGARVHTMTPEAHDHAVAYLSHLPQILASALMHLVGERTGQEGLALAGRGLRDTTRLASSPASIWGDIAATNRDNISRAIDELIQVLVQLKAEQPGADAALATTFESAARWRRVLDEGRESA